MTYEIKDSLHKVVFRHKYA